MVTYALALHPGQRELGDLTNYLCLILCQIYSSLSKLQELSRRQQKKRGNGKAKIIQYCFLGSLRNQKHLRCTRFPFADTERTGRGHDLFTNVPAPLSLGLGCKGAQNLAQRNYHGEPDTETVPSPAENKWQKMSGMSAGRKETAIFFSLIKTRRPFLNTLEDMSNKAS